MCDLDISVIAFAVFEGEAKINTLVIFIQSWQLNVNHHEENHDDFSCGTLSVVFFKSILGHFGECFSRVTKQKTQLPLGASVLLTMRGFPGLIAVKAFWVSRWRFKGFSFGAPPVSRALSIGFMKTSVCSHPESEF